MASARAMLFVEASGLIVAFEVPSLRAQQPAAKKAAPSAPVEVSDVFVPQRTMGALPAAGGWVPVYVELKSLSGKTETVNIEGTVSGANKRSFVTREAVEVAAGAPKRAWVYLRAAPSDVRQTARLEVRSQDGSVVRRDGWDLSTLGAQGARLAMLVVGENLGDITPWPGSLPRGDGHFDDLEVAVDSCSASRLPDSLLGYQAIDTLILRDLGAQALEKAQLEALKAWVYLGGHVIFAPRGRSGEVFHSETARVLFGDALREVVAEPGFVPGRIRAVDSGQRVPSRLVADGKDVSIGEGRSYVLLDPLSIAGAREIVAELSAAGSLVPAALAERRLYAELPIGRGNAAVLTFDDQTFRDGNAQAFLAVFWGQIVAWRMESAGRSVFADAARFQSEELVNALRDPSREVGVNVMIGLIGGYLILAGPVLYFVLKRKKRLTAVIWAEPVLVVVYLGVIFTTAYVTKGVLTKTRLLTFISQREGDRLALRESYLSIFSADEATYRISSGGETALLRPLYKNAEEERPAALTREKGGQLTLSDFPLAHWQEGHVSSMSVTDLAGQGVELKDVAADGDESPRVAITNRLPFAIREGVYYGGDGRSKFAVPAIEPGKTAEVALSKPLEDVKYEKRLGIAAGGHGAAGRLRLAALVERTADDFTVDQRTTLKERLDYYLLYR